MQGVVNGLNHREHRVQAKLQGVLRAPVGCGGHQVLEEELVLGESLDRLEDVGGEWELVTQLDLSQKLLIFYQGDSCPDLTAC